jgi:hypothetical protein
MAATTMTTSRLVGVVVVTVIVVVVVVFVVIVVVVVVVVAMRALERDMYRWSTAGCMNAGRSPHTLHEDRRVPRAVRTEPCRSCAWRVALARHSANAEKHGLLRTFEAECAAEFQQWDARQQTSCHLLRELGPS